MYYFLFFIILRNTTAHDWNEKYIVKDTLGTKIITFNPTLHKDSFAGQLASSFTNLPKNMYLKFGFYQPTLDKRGIWRVGYSFGQLSVYTTPLMGIY